MRLDCLIITRTIVVYSRGLRFENVSLLISNLEEVIQEIGFCWKDKEGVICKQKGAFRVNCIDCLDRTNVVQVNNSL